MHLVDGKMGFNHIDEIIKIEGNSFIKSQVRNARKKILREIIEQAFGQELVDKYFPTLIESGAITYLEFQGRGVANFIPPSHLKTLAVIPDSQSNGIGYALFEGVFQDFRKLYWCSREDRTANETLYKRLIEEGVAESGPKFFRKDGRLYIPYYVNIDNNKKELALQEMKNGLIAFKQKN